MKKHFGRIKRAAAIGCICSGGLISQASALSLTFEQVANVGKLDRGGGGKDNEEKYIDQLARMTVSTTLSVQGTTHTRSGIVFDSLPAADFATRGNHDHTGIVLDGAYIYLHARYGSTTPVVRHVGGLTGNYDVPGSYEGDHGIAHYSPSRPDNVRPSNDEPTLSHGSKVPDSGSTLALLGLSLTSIGFLRRMFRNSCRRDNNDPLKRKEILCKENSKSQTNRLAVN